MGEQTAKGRSDVQILSHHVYQAPHPIQALMRKDA